MAEGSVRLDTWLWAARFFRTRALASAAVDGGKVAVNGARAKRAKAIRIGDRLRLRKGPFEYHLTVQGLAERRGPPAPGAALYEENPPPKGLRERPPPQPPIAPSPRPDGKGGPPHKQPRDNGGLT